MKKIRLLASDLHLTDNELERYRWDIFPTLTSIALENDVDEIDLLGDSTDRKDRHPGNLLNKFVHHLQRLKDDTGATIYVLMGNHDMPLNGIPYWTFLNALGVRYVTTPELHNGVWYMPFSDNPLEEWKDLPLAEAKAILMHQTVEGAWIDEKRQITSAPHPMPLFPRGVPVYSGDVHRPQRVGSVTYVGAAHPVRFGENWRCRALLIKNDDFANPIELFLPHPQRIIIDLKSSNDLLAIADLKPGDQIRIRYHLSKQNLTQWPVEQEIIRTWAAQVQVNLVSMEAVLVDEIKPETAESVQPVAADIMAPADVIRSFAADQQLDDLTREIGLELLTEAQG